jgi:hypothetical protein
MICCLAMPWRAILNFAICDAMFCDCAIALPVAILCAICFALPVARSHCRLLFYLLFAVHCRLRDRIAGCYCICYLLCIAGCAIALPVAILFVICFALPVARSHCRLRYLFCHFGLLHQTSHSSHDPELCPACLSDRVRRLLAPPMLNQ